VYGLLFGLAVVAWLLAPFVSLVAFLVISWFHFGSGDASGWGLRRSLAAFRGTTTAGLVLGLPMALHSDIVAPIFTALQLGRRQVDPSIVRTMGAAVLAIAFPAGAFALFEHLRRRQWAGAGELLVLLTLGSIASPLVTFAAYFALWHSPRHILEIKPSTVTLSVAALASAVTILMGLMVWSHLQPTPDTATQVVFIGLGALTVPHLIVTAYVRSSGHRSPLRHR
jgi:beta-carotene 15,15'-dioxygenase